MAADEDGLRVPKALRTRVREIAERTDAMCASRLDSEYAELCRRLAANLARKRPSPIERGEPRGVGRRTDLRDRPEQLPVRPHPDTAPVRRPAERPGRRAEEHDGCESEADDDAVRLDAPMDPEFCRAELLADHPLAWLVEVNGLIVDMRTLPLELQAGAQRRGLIPDLALGHAA
jgi:uncharacterized protein DUF6398